MTLLSRIVVMGELARRSRALRLMEGAAMSKRADRAPLIGSAVRRRRTLAHLSPIFELHLNRGRNPSAVAWNSYDFIALIQLTVDTVALSSGLDGNLGAPRELVLVEMGRVAAMMAPHRPNDEHDHVARFVLDHLLRHDQSSPYFTVDYADADSDWQTVEHPVRVLYETLALDGATLQVNVDLTAVSILLVATNRSLEDEHEAVIAVLRAQADSGRLDAAMESAEDALTLSRTYAANVRRMMVEAERDVSKVNYINILRPELATASRHLDRRIQVDGTLLQHLGKLRSEAVENQDPQAVRELNQASSRLVEATETLAELHTEVVGAAPRWRAAQAAQAFTAVPATEVDPTSDVLTALLTGQDLPAGADSTPPMGGTLLNLVALANRLVAPPRRQLQPTGPPVDAEPLDDADGVYEQFPALFHDTTHVLRDRRIEPGMKARLSELLTDVDALFRRIDTPTVAELVAAAGSPEVARRRLRLLLVLDAMMLWRPDGPDPHDDWWTVDDDTRASLPDLDIPDLLVFRRARD